MKEYRRSGEVAPLILTLSTRWRRSESRSGRSTSGKGPGYSLNRRLGVPESIWTFWIRLKKKKSLVPTRNRTPDRLACSLVATQTTYSGGDTGMKYVCWWKDTDRIKPCNRGKNCVPVPLCVVDNRRERTQHYWGTVYDNERGKGFNPLKAELNPICYLLALLAQNFLHVSRIRVKIIKP